MRRCAMKRKFFLGLTIACVFLLIPGLVFAGEKFGLLFDIQGDAVIHSPSGKTTKLQRSRHILKPANIGDTIEVNGEGRVIVVSLRDKKGYLVSSNTTAIIESTEVKAIKGMVDVKEGFNAPLSGGGGPIGATVLRAMLRNPCIRTISPLNTAIVTLRPKLKWENSCEGSKAVIVKVLADRKVIYDAKSHGNSITIPENVLSYEKTYRWLVDGGATYGIIGGTFSTVKEDVVEKFQDKYRKFSRGKKGHTERLSYVFFLLENRLQMQAQAEIESLKKDFPENTYIQEL
jgi:hypothetical protein